MLKRGIYFTILFVFYLSHSFNCLAQNIDSLKSLLRHASDSQRAELYLKIGEKFQTTSQDSALYYFYKAEKIAKENHFTHLMVDALNYQAISLDESGYILQAKEKIDSALAIARDSVQINYLINNLAIIYTDMGLYDKAYKIFIKNLAQYKRDNDSDGISGVYSNLSSIFMEMKKYDSVLYYNYKAYEIDSMLKDTFYIVLDYLNIGIAYTHKKEFSLAKKTLLKAIQLAHKSHKNYMFPDLYRALGNLYSEENQTDSAFYCYQLSKQWDSEDDYNLGVLYDYMALAKLFLSSNPQKSKKYLDSAANYAKDLTLTDLRDYYKLKFQVFEKLGKYDSAFYYIQKYYTTKDSINFTRQRYAIEVARLDRRIKQAQSQIKKSAKSLARQKKKSLIYFHFAIFALIFSAFLIYLALKLKKQQKALTRANAQLQEARKKDEIQLTLFRLQKKAVSIGIDEDLSHILEILLHEVLQISWLKLQKKALIFLSDDGQELYLAASVNAGENIKNTCSRLKPGECLCGQAFKNQQTIIETDVTENHSHRYKGMESHGHYVAPIYSNKKLLGVLCLYLTPGYELQNNEKQFLEQFLILLSNIIDRKLKTEKIKSALEKQDQLNQKLFAQSLLLEQQKMQLERTSKKLAEQSEKLDIALRDIKSSITYTSYIINTLMPSEQYLKSLFKEFFLIFKPIEEIGGDFYYARKIDNKIFFAVGDATGHGVPGAFLASHAIFFINDIINKNDYNSAADILTKLRIEIKNIFEKVEVSSIRYSSIDMAFCIVDTSTNVLNYAGAYIPFIYIRDNELIKIKAVRSPIGLYINEKEFQNHFIELRQGDVIYLQSDGFADQLRDEQDKKYKFTVKRYEKLLLKIHHLPMNEQKQILLQEFEQWKGNEPQIDDITILGIRWHNE